MPRETTPHRLDERMMNADVILSSVDGTAKRALSATVQRTPSAPWDSYALERFHENRAMHFHPAYQYALQFSVGNIVSRLQEGAILEWGTGSGMPYDATMFSPRTRLYAIDRVRGSIQDGIQMGFLPGHTQIIEQSGPPYERIPEESIDLGIGVSAFHALQENACLAVFRDIHRRLKPGAVLTHIQDVGTGIPFLEGISPDRLRRMEVRFTERTGISLDDNPSVFFEFLNYLEESILQGQTMYFGATTGARGFVDLNDSDMPILPVSNLLNQTDSILQRPSEETARSSTNISNGLLNVLHRMGELTRMARTFSSASSEDRLRYSEWAYGLGLFTFGYLQELQNTYLETIAEDAGFTKSTVRKMNTLIEQPTGSSRVYIMNGFQSEYPHHTGQALVSFTQFTAQK